MKIRNDYDVLIIGSGASGGMASFVLTQKGIRCLMLDAGPVLDTQRDSERRAIYDLPFRGFGRPGRFPHVTQADEFNANLWLDENQNPYSYPPEDPYYWVRVRLVGGKTLLWGRTALRLSDYEFRCKDHDGFGDNWPIRYADLAPYYDRVEPLFHVSGRNEGLPQLPDGKFTPDTHADSQTIQRFMSGAKRVGIATTKARISRGRQASSANLLLPTALDTGNLQLVPNAVVRRLTVDKNTGLVNGADFLDRVSHQEFHAKAKVVIVGASCLESTRLLLNSGIANSSGVLGRYLFDQFYVKGTVVASVPEARDGNGRWPVIGGEGYVPRFRNLKTRENNFVRGYAADFSCGGNPNPAYFPSYGAALHKQLASAEGSEFSMTTMGEVLPRYENHVRIDPLTKDVWGIPSLHIEQKYSDNEINMARNAMETFAEICQNAGFDVLARHAQMVPPGESIHDLGTCRMGDDPKRSVLNKWNQSHDVQNLFVMDGSSFVSGGSQNPTLTILALAMRASEYLAELLRKREL